MCTYVAYVFPIYIFQLVRDPCQGQVCWDLLKETQIVPFWAHGNKDMKKHRINSKQWFQLHIVVINTPEY